MATEEVFENQTTIFYTYEVDSRYRPIVEEMARAIYQHDNASLDFPTGSDEMDMPYICRADDALRVALPLLRKKFADE